MPKSNRQFIRYAGIIATVLVVAVIVFPFYPAVVGSLTPWGKMGERLVFPEYFHWQNYSKVWTRINLGRLLLNSTIYGLSTGILIVLLSIPAGYALSRFKFGFRMAFNFLLLTTQMIPIIIVIVPLFFIILRLGLFDAYLSVILVATALGLPFPVWLLTSYFDTIPVEIEEAAMVDGCSRLQAIRRVLLPSIAPGVFTGFMLAFAIAWCRFLTPNVFITSDSKWPITVGIYNVARELVVEWNLVMAASLIGLIPPVILYFLAQRYIVGGLTAGAVKG